MLFASDSPVSQGERQRRDPRSCKMRGPSKTLRSIRHYRAHFESRRHREAGPITIASATEKSCAIELAFYVGQAGIRVSAVGAVCKAEEHAFIAGGRDRE